jgi:hypothetical protein
VRTGAVADDENDKAWAELEALMAELQGGPKEASAWAELEAKVRHHRETEVAARAVELIHDQVDVLRRHGEADAAAKLHAVLPTAAPPAGLLGDSRAYEAMEIVREQAEVLRSRGRGELADKVLAAIKPPRRPGGQRQYTYDDVERLLDEFMEIVTRQPTPNVSAAARKLADREPWNSMRLDWNEIRDQIARRLREIQAGLTPRQFAKHVWQEAKEAEANSGTLPPVGSAEDD